MMIKARYPSYKDLDKFINVKRLAGLDAFVTDRLRRRLLAAEDRQFFTGPFLLDPQAPVRPGSRMVALTRSRAPEDYYDLDRTELWEPT